MESSVTDGGGRENEHILKYKQSIHIAQFLMESLLRAMLAYKEHVWTVGTDKYIMQCAYVNVVELNIKVEHVDGR